MKKGILAVTVVLVLTVSVLALAQMDKGKEMMGDKGMGMMDNMKDMCPMMKSMMGSDGKKEDTSAPADKMSPSEHESHH